MEIAILEFGVFDIEQKELARIPNDQTSKGYVFDASIDIEILKNGTKIPVSLHTAFGIRYKVVSDNPFELIDIKILHPEIENADNFSFREIKYTKIIATNSEEIELYVLEEKWEMVPGYWTFQLFDENHLLIEKEFELYETETVEEDDDENFFYDM